MYKTTRNIKQTTSDSQCSLNFLTFKCDASDDYDDNSCSRIGVKCYSNTTPQCSSNQQCTFDFTKLECVNTNKKNSNFNCRIDPSDIFKCSCIIPENSSCKTPHGTGICLTKDKCKNKMYNGYCTDENKGVYCCVNNSYIKGVDVSNWNGTIDWNIIKQNKYKFAWIKASQGVTYKDPTYLSNRTRSKNADILVGTYHTADMTKTPEDNAFNFLSVYGGIQKGELLPALNIVSGGMGNMKYDDIIYWCIKFGKIINIPMLLYVDNYTLNTLMNGGSLEMLKYFPYLWYANYRNDVDPGNTGVWDSWTVWQYIENNKIIGIQSSLSINKCDSKSLSKITISSYF